MKNYLYLDVERFKEITRSLESSGGEFANENQEKQFDDIIDWSLDKNMADGILAWKELRASIESAKSEMARISAFKSNEERKMKALTDLLMEALKIRDSKAFGSGLNSMSLAKCPPSLPPTEEIDEMLIPEEFYQELPTRGPLRRSLLLKAVKNGVVNGVNLVTNRVRLRVK